ncbi:hypothetical protein DAPK24_005140 [Pichia kluyveri]|uniref:Uncharacterized protein n=1 Tax=Pichia kluyveri TaxID=36015 RepID=A0AAV5QZW4_PICKL|nr:hypothetical protein DAPK24_005140 [Pichia kluyveri]
MSSLFVAEEAEQEIAVKIEHDGDIEMNGIEENNKSNGTQVKEEPETEEKKYNQDHAVSDSESDDDDDDDDPVIDTIPVHLNLLNEDMLSPLLLQFPTKSRQSNLTQNHISALHRLQIKPKSGVVELRLPLNTGSFFSNSVSEKYNVSEQYLRGIIIHDEPLGDEKVGTISSSSLMNKSNADVKNENENDKEKDKLNSFIVNTQELHSNLSSIRAQPGSIGGNRYLIGIQDENGELHITPISDTCMLRPHFVYIDNTKLSKIERERELERELNEGNNNKNENKNEEEKKKANVSVVTMSAKSTKENLPRLGGALLSAKIENEEDSKSYQIMPSDGEFIKEQFTENSGNVLSSQLSQNEYLDLLLNQAQLE